MSVVEAYKDLHNLKNTLHSLYTDLMDKDNKISILKEDIRILEESLDLAVKLLSVFLDMEPQKVVDIMYPYEDPAIVWPGPNLNELKKELQIPVEK